MVRSACSHTLHVRLDPLALDFHPHTNFPQETGVRGPVWCHQSFPKNLIKSVMYLNVLIRIIIRDVFCVSKPNQTH